MVEDKYFVLRVLILSKFWSAIHEGITEAFDGTPGVYSVIY